METNILLNSTTKIMMKSDPLKTTTVQINERIVDNDDNDDNDDNNILVLNRHQQGDSLRNFPKIELHAHLNGSIRERTLFDLAKERGIHLNDQYFSLSSSSSSLSSSNADTETDLDATMEGTGSRHNKQRHRSLQECFVLFTEIGKVVVDLDAIRQITREALEDFAKEGVVYLELRSTPKRLLLTKKLLCCDNSTSRTGTFSLSDIATDKLATKRQYCETIIDVLIKFRKEEEERYKKELEKLNTSSTTTSSSSDVSTKAVINPRLPMIASFIVSIDRSNPVESGFEHVDLAIELAKEYPGVVVGVDLGGNPLKRSFIDFRNCFEKARRCGLSITLHCGEVPCSDEDQDSEAYQDALAILEFGPMRLGHALILPPTLQEKLARLQIPVETCPTSNVLTTELVEKSSGGSLLDGIKHHPQMRQWIQSKHPLCICTDDPGVFNTDVTKEFVLLQDAFGLTTKDFKDIVLNSVDYAFTDKETKRIIRNRIQAQLSDITRK